jgi:glycosyltransferase involved in cell wall biosynthesis
MDEQQLIKISVIITTYKRASKLERTLATLHSQTRQPDELIISDDCSPDDTEAVAQRWAPKFRHCRVSRNPTNLKMPGNLNVAMALARGVYIANLHDADTFQPQLLEKWEKALDDNPTAGFVFCGTEDRFDEVNRPSIIHLHGIAPLTAGRKFFIEHYVGSLSGPVWGTVMGRKAVYDETGPYDAKVGWLSDVDMRMRMCARYDVAYVREALLIIDNEATFERKVRWEKFLMHDRIVTTNIRRLFADDPAAMHNYLRTQRRYFRKRYFRIMLGRIYHWDHQQVYLGLRLGLRLFFRSPLEELV